MASPGAGRRSARGRERTHVLSSGRDVGSSADQPRHAGRGGRRPPTPRPPAANRPDRGMRLARLPSRTRPPVRQMHEPRERPGEPLTRPEPRPRRRRRPRIALTPSRTAGGSSAHAGRRGASVVEEGRYTVKSSAAHRSDATSYPQAPTHHSVVCRPSATLVRLPAAGPRHTHQPPVTEADRDRFQTRGGGFSSMRQYELMVIASTPSRRPSGRPPPWTKFLGVVKTAGGSVDKVDVWGASPGLPIKEGLRTRGKVVVASPPSRPRQELDRQLGLSELVMRNQAAARRRLTKRERHGRRVPPSRSSATRPV